MMAKESYFCNLCYFPGALCFTAVIHSSLFIPQLVMKHFWGQRYSRWKSIKVNTLGILPSRT